MMKKRLFLMLCCIVPAFAGCTKEDQAPDESHETVPVNISVPLSGRGEVPCTKTTDISNEENVNSLQVFMFRSGGVLEAYGNSDENQITLECTVGEKNIVVIVNAPSITGIKTMEQLEGRVSDLKDNSVGALVMYGSEEKNISAALNSFTIPVTRLVARLSIAMITNRFKLEQYRNSPIGIRRIYLVNAAGDVKYSMGAYTPAVWYNKRLCSGEGELPGLLSTGALDNVTVGYESSYSQPHYFYCYPNPATEDAEGEEWSPRFTRIVVETEIEGRVYYYPVSIEGPIESNHTYHISELVITRLGSEDPDTPVSKEAVSFNVEVREWVSGSDMDVTI